MGLEEELQYRILSKVAESKVPVGSGALAQELRNAGFQISEATAGRILRQLDADGLTERSGYRGRELTPLGYQRLAQLKEKLTWKSYSNEFMKSLKVHGRNELLDLLVARRAIERENARLAALNARPEHLDVMRAVIARHELHFKEGIVTVDDIQFHRAIAEAGGNRVLLAATDLIRQNIELTTALEVIRRKFRRGVIVDHKRILAAIESRDPEASEAAMIAHLENVIRDVNAYWNETGGNASAGNIATHGF